MIKRTGKFSASSNTFLKKIAKARRLLLSFLVLVLLGLIFLKFNLFNISEIKVNLENINCAAVEQIKSDSRLVGQNIFFIDEDKFKQTLIQKYLCIKEIQIEKFYLQQIEVKVVGRKPFVKIGSYQEISPILALDLKEATPSSSTALLDWSYPTPVDLHTADETGFVFDTESKDSLPLFLLPGGDIKLAKQVDQTMFEKLSLIFNKLNMEENIWGREPQMKIVDNELLIKIFLKEDQKEQKIIFALERDILKQLASLQLILQKAKIDNRVMEMIDLRFDKPVVIYFQKTKS